MPANFVKWTDEQVERLRQLHAQQYSCAIIASMLADGFTRNAVIGKLHRLGLSNSSSTVHRDNQYGRKPRPKKESRKTLRIVKANGYGQQRITESAETALAELRCVEIVPRHVALLDLDPHHCRYPYGDSPFTFCGHLKNGNSSYCGPHDALSRSVQRPISAAVQEQRRRTLRANYKLALVEVA